MARRMCDWSTAPSSAEGRSSWSRTATTQVTMSATATATATPNTESAGPRRSRCSTRPECAPSNRPQAAHDGGHPHQRDQGDRRLGRGAVDELLPPDGARKRAEVEAEQQPAEGEDLDGCTQAQPVDPRQCHDHEQHVVDPVHRGRSFPTCGSPHAAPRPGVRRRSRGTGPGGVVGWRSWPRSWSCWRRSSAPATSWPGPRCPPTTPMTRPPPPRPVSPWPSCGRALTAEVVGHPQLLADELHVPGDGPGQRDRALGGGHLSPDGILVSFEEMDAILEIDLDNHVAVVQPGVTLEELNLASRRARARLPGLPR